MGRTPCCDKKGLKKGPWTSDEDELLVNYIKNNNGHGSWRSLPKLAGLLRCGKSCRLRWTNYLRPDIKRGPFTQEEEKLIIQLHSMLGNRWAAIASQLPGRTDNEIKNLWNTHLKKRLLCMGLDPQTHEPFTLNHCPAAGASSPASPATRHMAQWESARLEAEARLSRESSLFGPPPQPCSKTDSDYFLRLWNSEVGDSFRNLAKREGVKAEEPDCHGSPASQASSSTKCGSVSALTTEVDPACAAGQGATPVEKTEFCTEEHCAMAAQSDCSSSNDMEDESDTALQLLLDFPINNDMSFLEGNCDDYACTDRAMFSENSFLCPL